MSNSMEKQILKLAKILNKFSIDDLSSYMDEPSELIMSTIKNLCKDDKLKKVSENNYCYIKPTEMQKCEDKDKAVPYLNNVFNFEKDGLFNPANYKDFPAEKVFQRASDLEYYNACTAQTQQIIIKQVILFILIGDLSHAEVQIYLQSLVKKNPIYKMNAQWYKIKLKRFIEEGVPGLYRNQLSNIDNGTYKIFKELYLSPKRYSQDEAYAIMRATVDDDSKLYNLATYAARLRKEYSQEAIKKMRSIPKQEEINEDIKKLQVFQKYDKPEVVKFEVAAKNYWNAVIQNNLGINRTKVSHIKKLIAYFGDFLLGEIVYAEIQKYRKHLISKGVPVLIVRAILQTLALIMKISGINLDYQLYSNMNKDIKLLTLDEIKEIITKNTPETWVIAMGLRINDLEEVCYEDIDFNTRELILDKSNYKGKIRFFRKHQHIKRLKIPVLIINKLNRNKKGRIFKDVYIDDYEKYLYAHVMLMLSQNVSINIISKNMGYKSLHTFEMLFGHLLPQELDKDFDIFKNINYRFS